MHQNRFLTLLSAAALGAIVPLAAQSTDDDVVKLEKFEVNDVPIEESIIPSSRPFNSVFGTDRSIVDTPRSVTIISREQLDAISIKTPRDFARLTSSSYTKSNFGAPTSPNLRGQEADLFVNGIRKGLTSNGNGLPINFNAVESVNIVKGPAGAFYGTSNYLGGYADLITKRAYFDKARGKVSVTAGSYDTYYGSIDFGAPISDTLAYRLSFSGEDTVGYYYRGKKETQALYGTITWKPTADYELFVAAEFFNASYTENWGINRPTQALIDDGLYYPNIGSDADYAAYVAKLGNGDGVFGGGTPGVDFASIFGGAGFATIVPVDLANPVKIDRRQRLLAPGDDSEGKNFWAQAIQTLTIGEGLKLVNNTYFQWIDRNTFSSYHYSELLRDNWSFDNRLSIELENDTFGLNTGLRYRYQDVWAVNHFFNEPANFWDLTRDPDLNRVPDAGFVNNGDPIVPDQDPRGILNNWYYGGTGAHSTGYIMGPFAQFNIKPTEQIIIDLGAGLDHVNATEKDPITDLPNVYPGVTSSTGVGTLNLKNYSAALTYKVTETLSAYGTYGYSQSHPADTGGWIATGSFDSPYESELKEVGVKSSMLHNTLFASFAYFDRTFITSNPDGSTDNVWIKGAELEFNYQPNRNFYATFGYSYMDSTRTAGFFASAYTIDRADETGGYFVSPTFPGIATARYDYPGNPKHQAVALVSYKFDNGFGLRANVVFTGKYKLGYDGFETTIFNAADFGNDFTIIANTPTIPNQYEVDLTAFYAIGDWDFKLTVFNATDEKNWDAPNAGYGNGSVVPREPIRTEFTVGYKF